MAIANLQKLIKMVKIKPICGKESICKIQVILNESRYSKYIKQHIAVYYKGLLWVHMLSIRGLGSAFQNNHFWYADLFFLYKLTIDSVKFNLCNYLKNQMILFIVIKA